MIEMAKIIGDGMFTCEIFSLKSVEKKEIQGWANNPSTIRPNVTVDVVKRHKTLCWVDVLWVSKHY
jgi:hypothetical protein